MPALTRPSASEIVHKGQLIYDAGIRQQVEPNNIGKYVAIDILTGEYEIGTDHLDTVNVLHSRIPNAIPCVLKIGYPATDIIGGRLKPNAR
jgi:hypothetical protein